MSERMDLLRHDIYDALYGLWVSQEFGEHYVDGQEQVTENIMSLIEGYLNA